MPLWAPYTKETVCSNRWLTRQDTTTRLLATAWLLERLYVAAPYPLEIECSGDQVQIAYPGPRFGLEDLQGAAIPLDYEGGRGKAVLTANPAVSFEYTDGWNRWTVAGKTPSCAPVRLRIEIPEGHLRQRMVYDILARLEKHLGGPVPMEVEEIVTNACYHNNVRGERRWVSAWVWLAILREKAARVLVRARRVADAVGKSWPKRFQSDR